MFQIHADAWFASAGGCPPRHSGAIGMDCGLGLRPSRSLPPE